MEHRKRRRSDRQRSPELCRRFGVISVRKGFVTLEQVKAAIAEQIDDDVHGREHRPIGAILFDKYWITESQIEEVLREMHTPSPDGVRS
jgi:hypothetical protein